MTDIAVRVNPASVPTEERDIRVDDYLDDKLQVAADLDNVDSLLLNVKHQQKLLKEQLQDAQADMNRAQHASQTHASSVLNQVEGFTRRQDDIDRKLLIITMSETSDEAVRQFDMSMGRLNRLDVAKGYVELLAEVDRLSSETRQNFCMSPQAALRPFVRLQSLASGVNAAQPAAEGAAPHLVDFVENSARELWKQMTTAFGGHFEETMAKMNWPDKDIAIDGDLEQEWRQGVVRLLELQGPEFKRREIRRAKSLGDDEPVVLLPLEVMVKPLELRFRYHFDGDRPTNKTDKPEYFLSHIVGLLNTYSDFLSMYLQPILSECFKRSGFAHDPAYVDSTTAFIVSLLPMVRQKVYALLPVVVDQPQLLSHLIHELISFDTTIREEGLYAGGYGEEGWKGLAWEVLVKKDWFGKWLEVEKNFALSRYQSILDSKDSGELDYDSVDPGNTKPTKAAIRVNDLLESVTDRYRPLSSFSQKLRFLIDIQITIFDRFHDRLQSGLEAYLTMTSSIARTMQGISKEERASVEGVPGLERLCRVYGSAEYLEKKMRDWSDDIFFLELWEELQNRARRQKTGALAGSMSLEDVAERTSTHVGSEGESGALFDETASAYKRLRVRTEGLIQDMMIQDIRESLRPYGRINPWSSLSSDDSSTASLVITAELDEPVQRLTSYLSFLAGVLAAAPLQRIARQLCLSIQTYLWDHVLMRHSFTGSGLSQLSRDLISLRAVFEKFVGEKQGEMGMRKIGEAVRLLSLPIQVTEDPTYAGPALQDIEGKIFENNENARDVLQNLGLETLSEREARQLLERRIELAT